MFVTHLYARPTTCLCLLLIEGRERGSQTAWHLQRGIIHEGTLVILSFLVSFISHLVFLQPHIPNDHTPSKSDCAAEVPVLVQSQRAPVFLHIFIQSPFPRLFPTFVCCGFGAQAPSRVTCLPARRDCTSNHPPRHRHYPLLLLF